MKPSERIDEIRKNLPKTDGSSMMAVDRYLVAIMQYLDEEWESNRPCEHEPEGGILSNGCNYCRKCRVMYMNNL